MKAFQETLPNLEAYLTGNWLTDFANFSAYVYHSVPTLNWVGFYLFDGEKLQLGPFVGKPACTEIRPGRGVCGTAFSRKEALIVPVVDEFPGHITCDASSRAELVIPLLVSGVCYGVLDLDSPAPHRFSDSDRAGLEVWVELLISRIPPNVWQNKPWA